MKVILLTIEQAKFLYKRFDHWFVLRPMPTKNGKWYIGVNEVEELKKWFIDTFKKDSPQWEKAKQIWNILKDLPIYDTNDFPEHLYNTSIDIDNATLEDIAELEEQKAKLLDMKIEEVAA